MAQPVDFEGANCVYYGHGEVRDLPVYKGSEPEQLISCWRLTADELKQVAKTGVVWLSVLGSATPPMKVSGTALLNLEDAFGERPARAEPALPAPPTNKDGSPYKANID